MNRLARLLVWLFIPCILFGGVVGLFGALRISNDFVTYPFSMPALSVVTFLLSYRVLALGAVGLIERIQHVEFDKPSLKRGIVYSALLPYVLALVFLFLVVLGIREGLKHDSM